MLLESNDSQPHNSSNGMTSNGVHGSFTTSQTMQVGHTNEKGSNRLISESHNDHEDRKHVSFLQGLVDASGRSFEMPASSVVPVCFVKPEGIDDDNSSDIATGQASGHLNSVGIINVAAEAAAAGLVINDMKQIHKVIMGWRSRDREWRQAGIERRERERDLFRSSFEGSYAASQSQADLAESEERQIQPQDVEFDDTFNDGLWEWGKGFDSP